MKRTLVAIFLLAILIGIFVSTSKIQPTRASSSTIYIMPDGSINPSTANITTSDNITYTFTGNNYLPIVVNRSNIIINGNGYTLRALGGTGFSLSGVSNVAIKNTTITNCYCGIFLHSSCGNVLSGNNITANGSDGVDLWYSCDNNTLSDNSFATNDVGIELWSSTGNVLSGNNVTANSYSGVDLWYSCDNNTLSGNNVSANGRGTRPLGTSGNVLSDIIIVSNSSYGISLEYSCDNNTLSGNNVAANTYGFYFWSSLDNVLFGNNVTADSIGICLYYSSSNNTFFHNNFINNTQQVSSDGSPNTWDNGYPSGGNYWSNYNGTDLFSGPYQNITGSDGIGDTPYVIDTNNTDRYPLMGPFHTVLLWDGHMDIVSNSTLGNFSSWISLQNPYEKAILFNVTSTSGTVGFCRVDIPTAFMSGPWTLIVGGAWYTNQTIITLGKYTYIYFTYTHGTQTVQITGTYTVPEFQPSMLLSPVHYSNTLRSNSLQEALATKTRR